MCINYFKILCKYNQPCLSAKLVSLRLTDSYNGPIRIRVFLPAVYVCVIVLEGQSVANAVPHVIYSFAKLLTSALCT